MHLSNFFNGQRLLHTDMRQFQSDLDNNFQILLNNGLYMQGWVAGGAIRETSPVSSNLLIPFMHGYTSNGLRITYDASIDPSTWGVLSLLRDGYTETGEFGTAGGSETAPQSGYARWLLILAYHARLDSDLRATDDFTTVAYRSVDSFRMRIVKGEEFQISDDYMSMRPPVPEDTGDFLTIGDVLLLNDGGTVRTAKGYEYSPGNTWVTGVSHHRRWPLEHRFPSVLTRGCPMVVNRARLPFHWDPDPPNSEVFGPDGNMDFAELIGEPFITDNGVLSVTGTLHSTNRGRFLLSEHRNDASGSPVLNDGIKVTIPVYNTSTGDLTRHLRFIYDDVLVVAFTALPNTDYWANAYSTWTRQISGTPGNAAVHEMDITFPPGRSLIQAFATCGYGGRLLLGQTERFFDVHDGLYRWSHADARDAILPDRENIESLWQWNFLLGFEAGEFGGLDLDLESI